MTNYQGHQGQNHILTNSQDNFDLYQVCKAITLYSMLINYAIYPKFPIDYEISRSGSKK
jgi:hypothetical protein